MRRCGQDSSNEIPSTKILPRSGEEHVVYGNEADLKVDHTEVPQNQQPVFMNVTAPPGSQPGQMIHVQTPRGIFQVTVPSGIYGGMVFRIQV